MPPLDPIQAIIGLGVSGVLAVGIWALGTGRVRVGSLVDKAMEVVVAQYEKRLTEVTGERNDWRTVAQGATPELKRLNDLLDTAVKLLLDPRRADSEIDRIVHAVVEEVRSSLERRK